MRIVVRIHFFGLKLSFFNIKTVLYEKKILFGQITTKIFAFIGKHLFWENIDQKACHVV